MDLVTDDFTKKYTFSEIEKLYEEILQLRQENMALKFDLILLKNKVVQARLDAELESKCTKGLRNYLRGERS